jgi:signal transduction histidine kinase
MSEYQYYEFQAVDRPLTADEMREVRAYSTRADITSTRFVNEYNWGDFKGQPNEWMECWYDAFLYLTNWGSRQLMLRLPADALDVDTAQRYGLGQEAMWAHGDHVILSFDSDEEGGDTWDDDGSGWLASILPLRAELAGGDHRALYLAWLLLVQAEHTDEDEPEPPVPPGLGTPSGALTAFREFLRIDPDLVQVAAERSPPLPAAPEPEAVRAWIASLPDAERVELLSRVAAGQERQVRAELLRRLQVSRDAPAMMDAMPRTAQELLDAAEEVAEQRQRAHAEAAAREHARQKRKAEEARARHLDTLAPREDETWEEVDALIASKQPKSYDRAVSLLKDLRDLAARDGRESTFAARIQALRDAHAKKPSFLQRLRQVL